MGNKCTHIWLLRLYKVIILFVSTCTSAVEHKVFTERRAYALAPAARRAAVHPIRSLSFHEKNPRQSSLCSFFLTLLSVGSFSPLAVQSLQGATLFNGDY